MTYKKLLVKIREYLNVTTRVPECFVSNGLMICYCGKCKQKDYALPEDFSVLIAERAAEHYKELMDIK
jgi:hypothetical protein